MDTDPEKNTDDLETKTYTEAVEMSGGYFVWIVLLLSYFVSSGYELWATY